MHIAKTFDRGLDRSSYSMLASAFLQMNQRGPTSVDRQCCQTMATRFLRRRPEAALVRGGDEILSAT